MTGTPPLTNTSTITASSGDNSISWPTEFINNGVVLVTTDATETITSPTISGNGVLEIATGGDLILNANSVTPGQTIVFDDATGFLKLGPNAIGGFDAVIHGFSSGDTIVVQTTTAATFQVSGATISVIPSGGGASLGQLHFATAAAAGTAFQTPGALEVQALCFCAGTHIATPTGEVPVEQLAVGDLVLTQHGEARPITWIGAGRVLATRGRRSAATPVIIRKAALGDNVPHKDLHVTKGHSFLFGDVLIPIEFLVNHHSILWDDRAQEVELYHIETETHGVLLANGAPAESYRDDGNRWLFQNRSDRPDVPQQVPCAPVLTGGPVVDAVWRQLLNRAGRRKVQPLTDDPDLHLLVDGRRIDPINVRDDMWAFRLLGRPRSIRIRSHSAVPQELGVARDSRELGVALRRIVLAVADRQTAIDAQSAGLSDGYHPFESDNEIRWTDGDAAVPTELFADVEGPSLLMLHLAGTTRYIDTGKRVRVSNDLAVRFARKRTAARSA